MCHHPKNLLHPPGTFTCHSICTTCCTVCTYSCMRVRPVHPMGNIRLVHSDSQLRAVTQTCTCDPGPELQASRSLHMVWSLETCRCSASSAHASGCRHDLCGWLASKVPVGHGFAVVFPDRIPSFLNNDLESMNMCVHARNVVHKLAYTLVRIHPVVGPVLGRPGQLPSS